MVKKTLSLLIVGIIVGMLFVSFIPMSVMGMTGSGTAENPYMIYNVTDLQNMNLNLTAYYELANDIDASAFAFIPLGTFTGTLDGKGYSIANLNITQSGSGWLRIALFSINQGTIKHIKLTNCFISVSSSFEADAAGLVSTNIGIINDSSTTGTIKAIGTGVDPMACAAGLVWWNKGVITSSYSTAAVIATSTDHALAGGFIGGNDLGGQVTKSFAVGNVICTGGGTGSALGGGFVYVNYSGNITNCYSRGNVTASGALYNWVGGFIEYNEDIIEDSYSTGIPTASGTIGGFCADNIGTITSCYWDTDTSGTVVSDGGTGKTTAQMKTKSTFTNAGWLFSPESETPIWAISEYCNDGYPYICQFCYLEWMCTGGCGPAWDPEGDYDDATPLNGCSVEDNNSTWVITVPYFNYYKELVNGSIEVRYQPTTMINSPLLDMSGNGKDGVINWGMSIGDIDVGGILPYSAFTPTGTETIPTVIPDAGDIPTDETSGATGEGLPLYYSFKKAADSLGWSLPVTYTLMFIIVAIVVGVAGLVAMGTGWGFSIGFGATMVLFGQVRDGGGIVIVPGFILIFSILVAIFLGYIWRYT